MVAGQAAKCAQVTWRSGWLDLTLVAWCLIGLGLRWLNLASRPAWSDEWATVVFSLGHGFRSVPLDQLISLETLLAPARVGGAGLAQVVQSLMGESTHPPLYFVLSHVWIRLWQQTGSLIDLGVVRSLSVLFGCLTISLAYWLAQVSTQSKAIARTTAALMAVSPFGVYLAQDARHYTLALVFSILSMGCFLRAWRSLEPDEASRDGGESLRARPLGWSTVVLWVTANVLGIATHYFVGLLLLAQVTALLIKGVRLGNLRSIWRPLLPIAVAMGLTLLGSLPWAIGLSRIPGDRLTDWVHQDFSALELLGPPVRLVGTLTSMVMLPAVEQVPWGVAIASIAWVLGGAAWLLPQIWRGLRQQWPKFSTVLSALVAVLLAELGWILLATYGFQLGLDPGGGGDLFGVSPVVG
ncbi:MAG: hypothetical protein HC857_10310, partial [Synechococcales cyanobacterium RU_4_20]|nr:hypothetical protein [Synechococcales cyanobacterium RU_4_20]